MKDEYFRKVKITKVYDGDSFTADIDLGYYTWLHNQKFRIGSIDTPELRDKDPEMKRMAYLIRDYLRERIANAETTCIKSIKKGKYGRWICDLYIDGENIGDTLLEKFDEVEVYE